jgi:hypothetical protein
MESELHARFEKIKLEREELNKLKGDLPEQVKTINSQQKDLREREADRNRSRRLLEEEMDRRQAEMDMLLEERVEVEKMKQSALSLMKYAKSVEQKRNEETLKKLSGESKRLEELRKTIEDDLKARETDVEKRERDGLLLAEQNRKTQEEVEVRQSQLEKDLEALMAEKKETAEIWKQIEIESQKAVDVNQVIAERVDKLVENEKDAIKKELSRLKKLEKELATRDKELGEREKDHKISKGKFEVMEAEIKRKEEELVKKEKLLEERKEYLDGLKESLSSLL